MLHIDAELFPPSALAALGYQSAKLAPQYVIPERGTGAFVKLAWGFPNKTRDGDAYLKLVHCNARGDIEGPVAFSAYQGYDIRILCLAGGYCQYITWEDLTHRIANCLLMYSREYDAWCIASGDHIWLTSLTGRTDDLPIWPVETPFLAYSVGVSERFRIREFQSYGLKSWVDDLGVAVRAVTQIIHAVVSLAALF